MSLYVDIKKQAGSFRLDVRFEAESGVTSILGASGSGKSMTLKCIAGIEKPDSGRIVLDGVTLFDSEKKINLPPQKRRVGYLFQNYALFPNMTVRQNILCGMHDIKDRTLRGQKLEAVIKLMGLEGLEELSPRSLSGGQAQRTALARILVGEPKLLMLDEPFSALDAHLRDRLKLELRDLLQNYGRSVLMVTHSREEAYNMSSRIAVMADGRLEGSRETKALFDDPGSIPAAHITGCRNIVPAQKTGEYSVLVPDWSITLKTAAPVKENIKAIGIRAHYFSAAETENRYPVVFTESMEEPFAWCCCFRYAGQSADAEPVWWRIYKDNGANELPGELGISPDKILLLY